MKTTINTIIRSLSVAAILALCACEDLRLGDSFLEKAPGVDVTIDTIFSSKLYADRALAAAYACLRCGYPVHNNAWPLGSQGKFRYQRACSSIDNDVHDALTDIIDSQCNWAGAFNIYYNGSYSAETENWSGGTKFGYLPDQEGAWKCIRKSYLYINNVDRVPDMTTAEKRQRKAECEVMIAMSYLDLWRNFGGVPILCDAVEAGKESGVDYSRQTAEAVLDTILAHLDRAAANLPWSVPADEDGHMTKASALGLKCRALSFAASPLFNANAPYHNSVPEVKASNIDKVDQSKVMEMYWFGGYDANRWQKVVDACEEFFAANAGGEYALIQATGTTQDDYRNAWNRTYADRNNGEILIHTGRFMPTFADTYLRCYFGPAEDHGNNGRGYGGGAITLNFVDLFPYADGTPADYREWIKKHNHTGTLTDNPFVGRDPRLYESVMIVGDHFQGHPARMWDDGYEHGSAEGTRAYTGFCSRKMIWDYNDETFHNKPTDYSYLRLAEIYLIYAEALNETGRKQEAYEALNQIRRRVGLPDMNDALLAKVQSGRVYPKYDESLRGDAALREEILDERARELYFEEVRLYDMIRWKRQDIFCKTLYGIHMTIKSGSYEDGNLVLNFLDPFEPTPRYWRDNWDNKWLLSAFPTNEINKGYGLVQNPGW